ncbi:DUF1003-domain-containing protein [Gonapodya prolifera JEL478]|uniref:DUF1003-domain-containing protein n=1 Tax=Gonapodya prolifera (strain JEL478) TaxID=1344416 RepID=A0A139AC40_GONPJ|nr:DUF1003-domain-containing protein [Gonapodya prolifera JEL478]|eukprot:KXS14229.1 DUF1003-domain-containing protein [Gonapodya prolifera JEL478]
MSSPKLNGGFSGPGDTYEMALAPNDRSGENISPLHLDNNDHVKCAVCGANEPQVHVKTLRQNLELHSANGTRERNLATSLMSVQRTLSMCSWRDRTSFLRKTPSKEELALKNMGQYLLREDRWQEKFDKSRSVGEKAAVAVARQGGSWRFVIGLMGFLAVWMGLNSILNNFGYAWDAFPFMLLNLILSTPAAFQAPIIMM